MQKDEKFAEIAGVKVRDTTFKAPESLHSRVEEKQMNDSRGITGRGLILAQLIGIIDSFYR